MMIMNRSKKNNSSSRNEVSALYTGLWSGRAILLVPGCPINLNNSRLWAGLLAAGAEVFSFFFSRCGSFFFFFLSIQTIHLRSDQP